MFDWSRLVVGSAESAGFVAAAMADAAVGVPGWESVRAVELAASSPMRARARVDAVVAIERQVAWLHSLQQRHLAALAAGCEELAGPTGSVFDLASADSLASIDPLALADSRVPADYVVAADHLASDGGFGSDEAAAMPEATDRQWVREEVACALRVSGPVARERLEVAVRLCRDFPDTLGLLAGGSIPLFYAKTLVDRVAGLAPDLMGEVESAVVERAGGQTFAEFSRSLKRAILTADPQGAEVRHVVAVEQRDVRAVPLEDGIAAIWAPMSADRVQLALAGIDLAAHANTQRCGAGDERTLPQHRADALFELCTAPLHDIDNFRSTAAALANGADGTGADGSATSIGADGIGADGSATSIGADGIGGDGSATSTGTSAAAAVPIANTAVGSIAGAGVGVGSGSEERRAQRVAGAGAGGARLRAQVRRGPVINVTVALSTLLGYDEQPAELAGYGAIPASMARRIAADTSGTWRRLVTDPVGRLVDYGRKKYRPPTDLADHVMARDQLCVFPGCRRQARLCELDHMLDWDLGGNTNEHNLNALCVRHHHAKHDADWRLDRAPGQSTTHWTSPLGRTYRSDPPPLPISRLDPESDSGYDPDEPPPF